MSDNNLLFYAGNDQMEAAMLRSVLLFNGKVSTTKRQDMLLKAVLAIIIYGNGETTADDVVSLLSSRFQVDLNLQEVPQLLSQLKKDGLIIENEGKLVAILKDGKKVDFFYQLKLETESLINGVIERVLNKSGITVNPDERSLLPVNIQKALSVYYSIYGYKFFGVKERPKEQGVINAVESARKGLSNKVGNAVVRSLADTLVNPSSSELATLEKWARAYVTMEAMNLDPMLRNFKITKFSEKGFVIDTDVALNAITTHAKFSRDYKIMIDRLKAARCSIYIPEMVVKEILDHADAAYKWYGSLGPQVIELPDEYLDYSIRNVFIEDYVKQIQEDPEKRDMPFAVYLDNFRSKDYPSLIWDCLKSVFGKDIQSNQLNLVDLNDEIKQKLKDKVLEETQMTAKGSRRSPEQNEEIAAFDTSLYLSLIQMNKDNDGDEKPLSQRTYLVTSSDRTIKCAKDLGLYQRDICCNPKALLAMMQETGLLDGQKVEIINLFENPFLAYTANEVWNEVEPLLEEGAHIKYVDLRKLRLDVDAHIDRILTCKTQEERFAEAQRQTERGYLFAQDLVEANQTITSQQSIIKEKDSIIEEKEAAIQNKDKVIKDLTAIIDKKNLDEKTREFMERNRAGKKRSGKSRKFKRRP